MGRRLSAQSERKLPSVMVVGSAVPFVASARQTGGRDKFAILNAFDADQVIGKLANSAKGSANYQHLKAAMRVEMHVQRGCNQVQRLVLKLGQPGGQIWHIVIVYQRNGRDCFRRLIRKDLIRQGAAREIAESFSPGSIALARDHSIELLQEVVLH